MSFTVEDVIRLRDGWREFITVGEFTSEVAKAMGLRVPLLYLSKDSLTHINRKHPDISDLDLTAAPFVLKHGLIVREVRKPRMYLASHEGLHCSKRMGLSMKVAEPDREGYMTSFYRVKRRQMQAWLKRCEIIKTHD
jgi:hypothetical protein